MNSAARRFNAELSAVRAAAEAGLELGEFQQRLRSSGRLVATGFGQLLVADGGVKRDAWERSFGDVARELGVGEPSRGSFALVRSAVAPRVGAADVNPAVARSLASSTEPIELLRSAKTMFIRSETMFLKPNQLEDEFRKRPEFAAKGLVLVRDMKLPI